MITDTLPHPPPASGPFALATYRGPGLGETYVDPVFGSTIRQITADGQTDNIYGHNQVWNADGSLYLHWGKLVDTKTGVVHYIVPQGDLNSDCGFDAVDPNVFYYMKGATLRKVILGPAGIVSDTVYITAPSSLLKLGGSTNWMSADGRLILLSYGAEPSIHVWDTQNIGAGPFTGACPRGSATAYAAMLPSGRHIVSPTKLAGASNSTFISYAIDLAARTVSPQGVTFWDQLCGDHAAFLSPSDGRDMAVIFDCRSEYSLYAMDITVNRAGQTPAEQHATARRILPKLDTSLAVHLSGVPKGALRDWVYLETYTSKQDLATWKAYQNEILRINVLSGAIERLADHRSNSGHGYYSQPRTSVGWDGSIVGWASDMQGASVNIFTMATAPSGPPPPPPPSPVDCVLSDYSDWSPWAPINATTEQRTRSRTIVTPPSNGGAPCGPLVDTETRAIVVPPPPPPTPVDCVVGPAVTVSTVEVAPGVTVVTQTRAVLTPPANGGAACGWTTAVTIQVAPASLAHPAG